MATVRPGVMKKREFDENGASKVELIHPMTKEEYQAFWAELVKAEEAEVHGFEDSGASYGLCQRTV